MRGRRWMTFLAVAVCVAMVGPVTGAGASVHKKTRMTAKAKRIERNRLYRAVKKYPRLIKKKSFIKRAALVNFRLPIRVRLGDSPVASNPKTANLDLGASLGKRQRGAGGSVS